MTVKHKTVSTSHTTKPNVRTSPKKAHHQQTEESLREYESILSTAEEVANIGSWKWDLRTQKVTWSDQMFRLFGVEREGFDGDVNRVVAERIHPDDIAAVTEANRRVLEDAYPVPLSYRIVLPEGMERTVWAQGKLIRDETGNAIALTGYVQDITEQVRAEKKILQLKRLYATLSQVNQMIVRVKERKELFQTICEVAVQFGEFALAWVGMLDHETGDVLPVAAKGVDLKHWPFPIVNINKGKYKNALAPTAIRTSRVITSENIQTDSRIKSPVRNLQTYQYRAAAAIPIQLRGGTIGVLGIFSSEAGFFNDEEEIRLLQEMGLDISFALDNMENEKQRKQAEEAIQSRSRQLEVLLNVSRSLTESLNLPEVLQRITDKLSDMAEVETTAIYLINKESLYLGACTPPLPPDMPEEFRIAELKDHPHIAEALAGRQIIALPDAQSALLTTAEQEVRDNLNLRTIMYIPVIAKQNSVGVLILGTVSSARVFSTNEISMANAVSSQAALAITNAQLYEDLARQVKELGKQITERKRIQDELRQLNAELEQRVLQRTMELSQANRAKDEFLANMSHELRTPLSTVLGLSESLLEQRRGSLNEKQVQSIELICSSGQHLLGLINDILEVSKIEAGKLELHLSEVSLKELCESSLNFIKELALKKQIAVQFKNETSISRFHTDPQRLKQILINLLNNAVKFTPEKGRVSLQVNTNMEQDRILFSIIDTGIGISAEDLKKLFTPFTQLDSSLSRQYAGTGLGLALVQKLTELHGGSIEVESNVGQGSRFTIILPLNQSVYKQTCETTVEPTKIEPKFAFESIASKELGTILLAEDNMINSEMVSEYLASRGYFVVTAKNGEEVLEKAAEFMPDLVLMDIQMPKMDGFEATRHLRSDPRFVSTPVIALTALAMPGDKERCLEAGVNEYLSKPVSLSMLVKTIESLLKMQAIRAGNKEQG